MSRVAYFVAPDGDTGAAIGAALVPHIDWLLEVGDNMYVVMSMKAGIDNQRLDACANLLSGLVAVDSRGGFFGQSDMESGLKYALQATGSLDRWKALGLDVATISYKIRVMLAHLRIKNDKKSRVSSPLRSAIGKINNVNKKSIERLSRPHPFINFRSAGSKDFEKEEEEERNSKIVCRLWDGVVATAYDEHGGAFNADEYFGQDGFAVARWHIDGVEDLPLEIPATWVVNGALVRPAITKKPARKRPGACLEDSEEEAAADVEQEDDDAHVFLKIMAGSGPGAAKIMAMNSGDKDDKTQILEVKRLSGESSPMSCKEVCEKVVADLNANGEMERCSPPVKGATWVGALRAASRSAKESILQALAA